MHSSALQTLLLCLPICGLAQGTFVYDQQSADETTPGGTTAPISSNQPIGQSFTPTLSQVGFIRLYLGDSVFNGIGATVYVNLRQDSITGPILSSTQPVFMPDAFVGHPDFLFASPVPVTPGAIYYVQPVVQSGDSNWAIVSYNYNYPGGTAFGGGQPTPPFDLWFREGIIVPEPSSIALALSGFACFAVLIRRHQNN